MKKGDNMKKNGFTIIEVALVLGIAGLIFLLMMIALPALQRQQRDTARKEDIDGLIANIKKYQTNNRGALPGGGNTLPTDATFGSGGAKNTWNGFLRDYMDDGFSDPSSGESYNLRILSCSGANDTFSGDGGVADTPCADATGSEIETAVGNPFENSNFRMYVIVGAKCAGDESVGVLRSSNPRKAAVFYKLEGGGLYCVDT